MKKEAIATMMVLGLLTPIAHEAHAQEAPVEQPQKPPTEADSHTIEIPHVSITRGVNHPAIPFVTPKDAIVILKDLPEGITGKYDNNTLNLQADINIPVDIHNITGMIRYADKSEKPFTIPVAITSDYAQLYEPTIAPIAVRQGGTASATVEHSAKNYVQSYTIENGENLTINPEGVVTVTAGDNELPGQHPYVIVAQYVDGTEDRIAGVITVAESHKNMLDVSYPDTTMIAGVNKTITTVTPPEAGVFSVVSTTPGWTATINEKTGEITTMTPPSAVDGDKGEIVVLVQYKDGSSETTTVNLSVVANMAQDNSPDYAQHTVKPGRTTMITQKGDSTLPANTTIRIPSTTIPFGWSATADNATGTITVVVPRSAPTGKTFTLTAIYTYPDGSQEEVPVTLKVVAVDAEGFDISYPKQEKPLTIGDTVYLTPEDAGETAIPDTATWSVETVKDWTVAIDHKGVLSVTPLAGATKADIPVTVLFEDGSKDTIRIPVEAQSAPKVGITYPKTTLTLNKPATIAPEGIIPAGVTFTINHDVLPASWIASVNDAGIITVTAKEPADITALSLTAHYKGTDTVLEVPVMLEGGGKGGNTLTPDSTTTPRKSSNTTESMTPSDTANTSTPSTTSNSSSTSNVTSTSTMEPGANKSKNTEKSTLAKTGSPVGIAGFALAALVGLAGFFGWRSRKKEYGDALAEENGTTSN